MGILLGTSTLVLGAAIAVAQPSDSKMESVQVKDNVYTLASGPNVEGVVYVQQGDWTPEVIETFHQVPWIDAASIRLKWSELEPQDQQFNWASFDKVLGEVKKYNEAHPDAHRTMHIRVMGGEHVPKWFEQAGVKMYDTTHKQGGKEKPLHIPAPYDNPEFLKQLREVYAAMVEHYKDEPLVTVYHGTWSAGPWDEIYHPQDKEPLPPNYSQKKFIKGMTEQLDVLIDEFSLKGKVAELPFSGKYPQKNLMNLTGPLTDRIVERLGRRSPFLYIQTNGWGLMSSGYQTMSWGHTEDIQDAYGMVNLSFQALGTNSGGGWMPQGNWLPLVKMAKDYEVAYTELYPPDFQPVDDKHNMTRAFTGKGEDGIGFKPFLKQRNRQLYVREGKVTRTFVCDKPQKIDALVTAQSVPEQCSVKYRVRTRTKDGAWSDWQDKAHVNKLPIGTEAEVEATLHTNDGYFTPRIVLMEPDAGNAWDAPVWYPKGGQLPTSQPQR